MSTPKVSVVVPVYNTEQYLKQCIDSITAQTLSDIEIILVDDGSGETCARLCDEIAKTDARIRVIHKENEGPGYTRNVGIQAATGEYIGFVDSDDYIHPEMYQSLCRAADEHGADLVISGVSFVGGNTFRAAGEYVEKHYFEHDVLFRQDEMRTLILGVVGALPHEADDSRFGVSVCKNLFRRSVLSEGKVEFLSERNVLSEDTFFLVDFLGHAKKAVGIHGAFYCYRRNDESFSKAYRSDRFEKVLVFLRELEERLCDTLQPNEYQLYLNRLAQGYGRILCSQEIVYAKSQNMNYHTLRTRLARICTSEAVAGALRKYPWWKLPKKQAAFAFAMKYRLYLLQKFMVTLRAR